MDRGARWATAHVVTKSLKYYSATKKKEIISFATKWMQLETVILSEISQKRERQIVYDITYIWNLKYGTNKHIYKTNRLIENRLVVAKVEGAGEEMK